MTALGPIPANFYLPPQNPKTVPISTGVSVNLPPPSSSVTGVPIPRPKPKLRPPINLTPPPEQRVPPGRSTMPQEGIPQPNVYDNQSFAAAIARSESSNRASVVNNLGYMGKYQFGEARLNDYKKDTSEEFNKETFLASPELQDRVFKWHENDIHNYITKNNLDKYIGQEIKGIPVTLNGLTAVAHLGGKYGMRQFLESGGEHNPHDGVDGKEGTYLTDYLKKFGGNDLVSSGTTLTTAQSAITD